jgi:hypothetical protein
VSRQVGPAQDGRQIVYGIDGRRDLTEKELPHLSDLHVLAADPRGHELRELPLVLHDCQYSASPRKVASP